MIIIFCNLNILSIFVSSCLEIYCAIWSNSCSISTVNSKLPTRFGCLLYSSQLFIIHCIGIFSPFCYICDLLIGYINTIHSYIWTIIINKKAIHSHARTIFTINKKAIITHRALACGDLRQFKMITQSKFNFMLIIFSMFCNL